jgi:F-type H+-transporting ATPase subunit b
VGKTQTAKTICGILLLGLFFLHLTGNPVMAEDGARHWRPVYDTIMLWINFGILAYLIYRFGRQPFLAFLKDQTNQVSDEIQKVEQQKQELIDRINETERRMQESSERYEQIKARIIEEGRLLRQQIIDDARTQGEAMIDREKKNASRRITESRNKVMAELADAATRVAGRNLPGELKKEDHSRLIQQYIRDVSLMLE